jgi:hypothetical protein
MGKKAIARTLVLLACLALTLLWLPFWMWWLPPLLGALAVPVVVYYDEDRDRK